MGSGDDAGYLVCEACNGFYTLKKGESLADFEKCECGGQLKHTKTLNNEANKKEPSPKNDFCPNCGTKNPDNSDFCSECGEKLLNQNVEMEKGTLFKKGYKIIDETDEKYVFSKKVTKVPTWAIIVLTLIFLPLVLLFFWNKPEIKFVEKYNKIKGSTIISKAEDKYL